MFLSLTFLMKLFKTNFTKIFLTILAVNFLFFFLTFFAKKIKFVGGFDTMGEDLVFEMSMGIALETKMSLADLAVDLGLVIRTVYASDHYKYS